MPRRQRCWCWIEAYVESHTYNMIACNVAKRNECQGDRGVDVGSKPLLKAKAKKKCAHLIAKIAADTDKWWCTNLKKKLKEVSKNICAEKKVAQQNEAHLINESRKGRGEAGSGIQTKDWWGGCQQRKRLNWSWRRGIRMLSRCNLFCRLSALVGRLKSRRVGSKRSRLGWIARLSLSPNQHHSNKTD